MTPQFANKLMASTLLWLDNKILTKGVAYYPATGNFYPSNNLYNGYTTYTFPQNQFVYDSSIPGITISTGIYVNNVFIGTGQSGFFNLDYHRGAAYFSTGLPSSATISGAFHVKEIDVKLTSRPEEVILFETKHFYKQKTSESLTGIAPNEATYPIIYIKNNGGQNTPFEFGGTDNCQYNVRFIILANSQFQLDAITSILRDEKYNYVSIMGENEYPFNAYGNLISGFNYTGLNVNKAGTANSAYISDMFVAPLNQRILSEIRQLNPEIYLGLVDATLDVFRST